MQSVQEYLREKKARFKQKIKRALSDHSGLPESGRESSRKKRMARLKGVKNIRLLSARMRKVVEG